MVDGATEVTVTLHDKREFKARVVGTDPRTDIAVLKIDGSNFPTLTLADSSKVEVGDIVLAIGDPFGVGQTVTAGIVSATGRGGLGIEQVEDFIQTDAPINPGNSGGALVDDEGHLIGINTAILAGNSGGNQGIGFAVPINMARHDMDEILAHGKVEHGYLGILPQDVTPALAKAFNASDTNGALVGEITPNSPAAHSSLKQGDIIVAVNGQAVTDASQLRTKIGMMDPNTTVTLKVLRNGKYARTSPSRWANSHRKRNAPASKRAELRQQPRGCDRGEPHAGYGAAIETPGRDQGRGGGPGESGQPRRRCWLATRRRDSAGESSTGQQCEGVQPGGQRIEEGRLSPPTGGPQRQHDVPGGVI